MSTTTKYGIAVEAGKFTPMRVEFDARGRSTQTPLASPRTMLEAEAILRPLGWIPYRERNKAKLS